MLMNESWELVHDSSNKIPIVGESNMDVVAWNDSPFGVHAHVESSINTVDSDVSDGMFNIGSVGNGHTSSRVDSVLDSSKKI